MICREKNNAQLEVVSANVSVASTIQMRGKLPGNSVDDCGPLISWRHGIFVDFPGAICMQITRPATRYRVTGGLRRFSHAPLLHFTPFILISVCRDWHPLFLFLVMITWGRRRNWVASRFQSREFSANKRGQNRRNTTR